MKKPQGFPRGLPDFTTASSQSEDRTYFLLSHARGIKLIGLSHYRGQRVGTGSDGQPIYESWTTESLEIGRDIFLRYAGENPLLDDF